MTAAHVDLPGRVRRVVGQVLGREPEPDRPLSLDSLATAELTFALEETFGVRLPDDARFGTVAEAVAHVDAALDQREDRPGLPPGFGRLHGFGAAVMQRVLRFYRLAVSGAENVPRKGPAVLTANHDSLLDIPVLVVASPRPVWFMAKEELFRSAFGAWFFHRLGGFPVRRGGQDVNALRAAVEVLRRGRMLGMYPESTRTPELLPFYPGAAWVALATGAPVVPVAIRGTREALPRGSALPRRANLSVRFGEPIHPGREDDPRARLERARDITDDLRVQVEKLLANTSG